MKKNPCIPLRVMIERLCIMDILFQMNRDIPLYPIAIVASDNFKWGV
jgi:hypothetical protein